MKDASREFEWCGALWKVEEQQHNEFRCVVVDAAPTSGWHVGDHCWLKPQEVHPAGRQ